MDSPSFLSSSLILPMPMDLSLVVPSRMSLPYLESCIEVDFISCKS
jgi:hypothetical protein